MDGRTTLCGQYVRDGVKALLVLVLHNIIVTFGPCDTTLTAL